ncbi:hypothetical protein DERP_011470 [Dermatophagoides pteronyssinus]|uniref:Uncharacterized protein n=1 Tax=Dermatophagoides pteronyssinus TaxID=6956 RepID=A0ABQ8J5E8_DERPT|nr:hypothetical protein DERP_011470 [Dermatophagoides pteronyssinus]
MTSFFEYDSRLINSSRLIINDFHSIVSRFEIDGVGDDSSEFDDDNDCVDNVIEVGEPELVVSNELIDAKKYIRSFSCFKSYEKLKSNGNDGQIDLIHK